MKNPLNHKYQNDQHSSVQIMLQEQRIQQLKLETICAAWILSNTNIPWQITVHMHYSSSWKVDLTHLRQITHKVLLTDSAQSNSSSKNPNLRVNTTTARGAPEVQNAQAYSFTVPMSIFRMVNFPFICGNIPSAPAYGVFISQLVRYAMACRNYADFVSR